MTFFGAAPRKSDAPSIEAAAAQPTRQSSHWLSTALALGFHSSTVPLAGRRLDGFDVDLGMTRARAAAEHVEGGPAITEVATGDGSACVLGYEASLSCYRPGNVQGEARLVHHALGPHEPPYVWAGAIVYRLAAPAADHYFLINDGPATCVALDTRDFRYVGMADAATGEMLEPGAPLALASYSGRWIRCEK